MLARYDFLGGFGLGLLSMYVFDPAGGRRRRALARDRLVRAGHELRDSIDVTARDLSHRTQGLYHEARGRLADEKVDDDVLVARVRSEMGRACTHSHAIGVVARDGVVSVSGPILEREVPRFLRAVAGVRGVKGVENRLDIHEDAGRISSLQGEGRRQLSYLEREWSPTARLLIGLGTIGVGLLALGSLSGLFGREDSSLGGHTEAA